MLQFIGMGSAFNTERGNTSAFIKQDKSLLLIDCGSTTFHRDVINKAERGKMDWIYQDTGGLDYEGNSHLSLRKLCSIIQPEFRNKVYCMHLDQHITNKEIEEQGFHVVEVYQIR